MEKLCIRSFRKDGLNFIEGCSYQFNYNKYDGNIYIHTVFGYTDISKSLINQNFL